MIHQFIFAAPRPGMTEQQFQDYWVNVHAVKYASKIPQIVQYSVSTRLPFGPETEEPLWSGLVGALVFLVSVGLMASTQSYQQSCGPGHRALVRSAIFFAAGVVAWTVVHLLIYLVDGPEAAGDWTLRANAFPLALTGLLIVANGPALPMRVAAGLWLAAGVCAALAIPRRSSVPVRFQPEEP